jgi:hypothetical protein
MTEMLTLDGMVAWILALMAGEAILFALWAWRRPSQAPRLIGIAANLTAGAGVMLAVYCAPIMGYGAMGLFLGIAGIAHGLDLTLRLRGR